MAGGAGQVVDLAGRTALVTGGGAGIGRACAAALATAGAKVHIAEKNRDAAERAASEIGGIAHVVDLTDAAAIELLPSEIDVLVNNAGMQHVAKVHEFPPDTFGLMQQLMVTAPFLLARRYLPAMYARRWGRIVNISSVHGLRASAAKAAYVAAKHGLEGLSKVIALEAAAHGVTSNCVNPGYVRTALVENQLREQAGANGIGVDDVVTEILLHRSAMKRLIEPEEVAATVTWLCGEHAGFITGASLPIDGAWSAS